MPLEKVSNGWVYTDDLYPGRSVFIHTAHYASDLVCERTDEPWARWVGGDDILMAQAVAADLITWDRRK